MSRCHWCRERFGAPILANVEYGNEWRAREGSEVERMNMTWKKKNDVYLYDERKRKRKKKDKRIIAFI